MDGLLKMATLIARNRHRRFPTGPLNRILIKAVDKYAPPLVKGRRFKILYAAQPRPGNDAREIPTVQLFVNHFSLLTPAYQRYLELQIRESFDIRGCPLKMQMRSRKSQDAASPKTAERAIKAKSSAWTK
jgi:GTP-binding protein